MLVNFNITIFFSLLLAIGSLLLPAPMSFAKLQTESFTDTERELLIGMFSHDEKRKTLVTKLVYDDRNRKLPLVLPKNIHNKQVKRNYSSFFDTYSLYRTKKFMKRWKTVLADAEKLHDVDKEAIVSIILVETGLGTMKGRYHVFSVFSSIVVDATEALKGDLENSARYTKKLNWAKEELEALFKLAEDRDINVLAIKGSRSGAFGIPQFLPSSYQKWGIDGDKNEAVSHHNFPDAIFSTANYLKVHGWKRGLDNVENRKAVFDYNNSQIYVDTIMQLAKKFQDNM